MDITAVKAVGQGINRVWYYNLPNPIDLLGYEIGAIRFSRGKGDYWVAELIDQFGRSRGQALRPTFKDAIAAGEEWIDQLA